MNNIFYYMHVNWYWAKQRPQFLAEQLSNRFIVTVYYPRNIIFFNKNKKKKFIKGIYILPFQRFFQNKLYRKLNNYLIYSQIKYDLSKSKYIWLSSPQQYDILKDKIKSNQILIYDCMDNFLEFERIKNSIFYYDYFYNLELSLYLYSNLTFVSSSHLKNVLIKRYGIKNNIFLINNAISKNKISLVTKNIQANNNIKIFDENKYFNIMYIGTISTWFDFELINKSLNQFDNIRYILIGPSEVKIPNNIRIISLGQKSNDIIMDYMDKADLLIMPFILNELIKAVDPVKIYEYILSNKPIMTIDYLEINKFKNYVSKYSNYNEYAENLKIFLTGNYDKVPFKEKILFLKDNTWEKRAELIYNIINSYEI